MRDKQKDETMAKNNIAKYETEFATNASEIAKLGKSALGAYVRLVSAGILLGLIGWNPEGKSADGMGRAQNDESLWQKIAESMGTSVNPRSYVSNITKLVFTRPEWAGIRSTDETLRQATINSFIETFGSLDAISKAAHPGKDKNTERESLETITDRYFNQAMCERNAYTVEQIVASVLAKAEAMLADREG